MDDLGQLSEYGKILLMGIIGVVLVSAIIVVARLLSPKNPNPIKLSTYECGEDTNGTAWVQINPRFYVIALVFLLFDVELIFIFPWATIFAQADLVQADTRWSWLTMSEMGIFIGVLIMGLWYIWARGDIRWIRPIHQTPRVDVNVPESAYKELNEAVYALRDIHAKPAAEGVGFEEKPAAVKHVGFTPRFKKK